MIYALLNIILFSTLCSAYMPVVLWHGMGDSCCFQGSLGKIISIIKSDLPGITVLSLKFGDSLASDVESSYLGNANDQVKQACETIASTPELQDGYNAIGFSQGAQLLRAVAQRCPNPPMRNLISLGGQHQGVNGLPRCNQPATYMCEYMRRLLNYGAYVGLIQQHLVQAQYWHDPLHEKEYQKNSIFLADINNEKETKNTSYVDNLTSLNRLVLVMFANDSMVSPRESSWFGFYHPGQDRHVLLYNQTDLYKKDQIGLKRLFLDGRVDFLITEGDHLQFSKEWFVETIIPYLRM